MVLNFYMVYSSKGIGMRDCDRFLSYGFGFEKHWVKFEDYKTLSVLLIGRIICEVGDHITRS